MSSEGQEQQNVDFDQFGINSPKLSPNVKPGANPGPGGDEKLAQANFQSVALAKSQATEFKDIDSPVLQIQMQKSMESAAQSAGTPAVLVKGAPAKQPDHLPKNQPLSSQDRAQDQLHQT